VTLIRTDAGARGWPRASVRGPSLLLGLAPMVHLRVAEGRYKEKTALRQMGCMCQVARPRRVLFAPRGLFPAMAPWPLLSLWVDWEGRNPKPTCSGDGGCAG
jgi:hypothetical protein